MHLAALFLIYIGSVAQNLDIYQHCNPLGTAIITQNISSISGLEVLTQKECIQLCLQYSECRISTFNIESKECQLIDPSDQSLVQSNDDVWVSCLLLRPPQSGKSEVGGSLRSPESEGETDVCELAKQLYPKRSTQFPRSRTGYIPPTCSFDCMSTVEYNSPNFENCTWKCLDGMSWIGTSDFELNVQCEGEIIDWKRNPKLLAYEMRLDHLNQTYVSTDSLIDESRPIVISMIINNCESTIPRLEHYNYEYSGDVLDDLTFKGWEAYSLVYLAESRSLTIIANTVFGGYWALRTFENYIEGISVSKYNALQSSNYYPTSHLSKKVYQGKDIRYGIPFTQIGLSDWPRYPIRGLLIDTARSFLPVSELKEAISQMSAAKLNVLQWHVSDNQSFSLALGTSRECNLDADSNEVKCFVKPYDEVVLNLDDRTYNITDYIHGPLCHGEGEFRGECGASMGPDAIYTRGDIADILAHAWLNGIAIIFGISSPSHARSWTAVATDTCQTAMWPNPSDVTQSLADFYNCQPDDALIDGNSPNSSLMCYGLSYQSIEYCYEQPCGDLNLRIDQETDEFKNSIPSRMIHAIMESLSQEVDWTSTEVKLQAEWPDIPIPDLNDVFQSCSDDGCITSKYIQDNDLIHIGLDQTLDKCLGNNFNVAGMAKWTDYAISTVKSFNWRPLAWNNVFYLLGDHAELLQDALPHIFDTEGDVMNEVRVTMRTHNNYIWSDRGSTHLNCGMGSFVATGHVFDCTPYKTFWDLYNIDPDLFAEIKLPKLTNDELRALGGISMMFSEQLLAQNALDHMFPRAAALGGALWTGRQDRNPDLEDLRAQNDVLKTFDYSEVSSNDFLDEIEWNKWAFSMAHFCRRVTPEKTVWCEMNGSYGDIMCANFSKSWYDYYDALENGTNDDNDHGNRRTDILTFVFWLILGTLIF